MWNDPWQENSSWVSEQGRNSKSVEWEQVVATEKTKFEMRIFQGKRKVRWAKRREGQSMWTEIHYSIISCSLMCTNLLDKKWMLKSYAGNKISQIMKKTTVAFVLVVSCIYHCFFFSFWICLWWCQMLTPSDLRQPVRYFQWSAVTGFSFQC